MENVISHPAEHAKTAEEIGFLARARSDCGSVRENNEDSFSVDESARFAIIADGMGGAAAGEVASEMATRLMSQELRKASSEFVSLAGRGYLRVAQKLRQIVTKVNADIFALSEEKQQLKGMGTTVDTLAIIGANAYIAHVGDSRVYFIHDGKSKQLTRDHTLASALVTAGKVTPEESRSFQNILLQALGTSPELHVEVIRVPLDPEDSFVLCTDGVWQYFSNPDEIADLVLKNGADAASVIVTKALERGGEDNATAVVVTLPRASHT